MLSKPDRQSSREHGYEFSTADYRHTRPVVGHLVDIARHGLGAGWLHGEPNALGLSRHGTGGARCRTALSIPPAHIALICIPPRRHARLLPGHADHAASPAHGLSCIGMISRPQ